jgi:hypothetical protein
MMSETYCHCFHHSVKCEVFCFLACGSMADQRVAVELKEVGVKN